MMSELRGLLLEAADTITSLTEEQELLEICQECFTDLGNIPTKRLELLLDLYVSGFESNMQHLSYLIAKARSLVGEAIANSEVDGEG